MAEEAEESREPGSELRVWLVTAGPGEAVWERYGHNAIRVLDTATGRDVSYNWGIFDFQQVDFIPRFLQGRMLYRMAVFETGPMVQAYVRADRSVVQQELALTPAQKAALRDLAERNALPENRDYVYQYFLDNCSTRVRDLLDRVLNGQLRRMLESKPTGISYRFHTRRLSGPDPLISAGMDLLLGSPTDSPISIWEELFLPLELRDALRGVAVADSSGSPSPLVLSEEIVFESTRASVGTEASRWLFVYAVAGMLLGGLFAGSATKGVRKRKVLRIAVTTLIAGWLAVAGLAGSILVLLLFTDHTFAWWNHNLFLFNPVMLLLAALLPLSELGARWLRGARTVAFLILGGALVGVALKMVPEVGQQNAQFVALTLPAHAGLALSLTWRCRIAKARS